jgi:lipopolysaccharide biosynthesis regulator YciM
MSPRPLIQDAEHWRKRAEEARRLAERMMDLESRRVMLEIAKSYDELAARAETKDKDKRQS